LVNDFTKFSIYTHENYDLMKKDKVDFSESRASFSNQMPMYFE